MTNRLTFFLQWKVIVRLFSEQCIENAVILNNSLRYILEKIWIIKGKTIHKESTITHSALRALSLEHCFYPSLS